VIHVVTAHGAARVPAVAAVLPMLEQAVAEATAEAAVDATEAEARAN
jgi:hypothetical protein